MQRNKNRIVKGILLVVVIFTARQYAGWAFTGPGHARMIIMHLEDRPFVYRVLIPWLSQLLMLLGLGPQQALTIVIVLSAIGLVYGIKYLLSAVRS